MVIDRMHDRCRRICSTKGKDCFINSKEQLNCIADMVVNKTAGASMLLSFSLAEAERPAVDENIEEAITLVNELSNWTQYLQLVQDLQALSTLVLDSTSLEKRKEIRYPLPPDMKDRIVLRIEAPESETNASLVNFSQTGARIFLPYEAQRGDKITCLLSRLGDRGGLRFTLSVVNCIPEANGFNTGGTVMLSEAMGKPNFFSTVFSLLHDSLV